jgi:hypothetical protein
MAALAHFAIPKIANEVSALFPPNSLELPRSSHFGLHHADELLVGFFGYVAHGSLRSRFGRAKGSRAGSRRHAEERALPRSLCH